MYKKGIVAQVYDEGRGKIKYWIQWHDQTNDIVLEKHLWSDNSDSESDSESERYDSVSSLFNIFK